MKILCNFPFFSKQQAITFDISTELKFAVAEIHPGAPNLIASITGNSVPGYTQDLLYLRVKKYFPNYQNYP